MEIKYVDHFEILNDMVREFSLCILMLNEAVNGMKTDLLRVRRSVGCSGGGSREGLGHAGGSFRYRHTSGVYRVRLRGQRW